MFFPLKYHCQGSVSLAWFRFKHHTYRAGTSLPTAFWEQQNLTGVTQQQVGEQSGTMRKVLLIYSPPHITQEARMEFPARPGEQAASCAHTQHHPSAKTGQPLNQCAHRSRAVTRALQTAVSPKPYIHLLFPQVFVTDFKEVY